MTKDQAIEQAKKIAGSIPATEDNPIINIPIPNKDSSNPASWMVTFKQEAYSEMDDRGFWMDLIKWEFESITEQNSN